MKLMNLIYRDELKAKLDRGDPIKLVMTLGDWAYRAKHIPGSLHFATREEAVRALAPSDEIIVYCAGVECMASVAATDYLESQGYTKVRRYAGGVADWEEAGYPLEGDMVMCIKEEVNNDAGHVVDGCSFTGRTSCGGPSGAARQF